MIDFITDKVILPLLMLILLGAILGLPVLFMKHKQHEAFLKDCFMQENRTKECEYALWKYENRTKTLPAIMTTPVIFK